MLKDKGFRIPKKIGVACFRGHFEMLPNFLDILGNSPLETFYLAKIFSGVFPEFDKVKELDFSEELDSFERVKATMLLKIL